MNKFEGVKESLVRCMITGDVMGKFYDVFLDSHSDIKPRFANTDFDAQKRLLRQSVNLAIMFANDNPVGKKGIERIRNSHRKARLNILPELYPYWKKSFIQVVDEFDPEFSDELKKQWDTVLQKTIDYVVDGYEV